LQSLDLDMRRNITDESIISISKNCTGLQTLNLKWCRDAIINSIWM